ncbi:hypothetical protein BDW74DRAFT_178064 [Aspergillus multicolor]|uniref:uncharacterized protein n=1 Tax=Aspergillus multicolor TaxID=41759 RepID=UPI003CCDB395
MTMISHPESGPKLDELTLAYNKNDDLILLKYPGCSPLTCTGFAVKTELEDSDAHIAVLSGPELSREEMLDLAKRWSGREVTGEEKAYYMEFIDTAVEQKRMEENRKDILANLRY